MTTALHEELAERLSPLVEAFEDVVASTSPEQAQHAEDLAAKLTSIGGHLAVLARADAAGADAASIKRLQRAVRDTAQAFDRHARSVRTMIAAADELADRIDQLVPATSDDA